jgi:prefoldin subunit 5
VDALMQFLISAIPVALGAVAVWRVLAHQKLKREEADIALRKWFQEQLDRRDQRIKHLIEQLDGLKSSNDSLQYNIQSLERTNAEMVRHRDEAEALAVQRHREFISLDEQLKRTVTDLRETQREAAQIPRLEASINALKITVDELQAELAEKTQRNRTLREQVELLYDENDQLKRENEQYENDLAKMNARMNELQTEISGLAMRVGQLEREKQELQEQHDAQMHELMQRVEEESP